MRYAEVLHTPNDARRLTYMHDASSQDTADAPLPVPAPSAIFKGLSEGGVIFSAATEVYFGVNTIGARIWELLPPVYSTVGEVCAALVTQYPEAGATRIQADVLKFLEELTASGLATIDSPHAASDPKV